MSPWAANTSMATSVTGTRAAARTALARGRSKPAIRVRIRSMQVAPPSTMKPSQMPAAKNSSNSRGPSWTSFSWACSTAFLMFLKSSSAANRTAAVTTMPMSRRGTISARPAPIRLPIVVGTAIRKASRHGIALRRAKSNAPESAPTSTGRRLVALAVAGIEAEEDHDRQRHHRTGRRRRVEEAAGEARAQGEQQVQGIVAQQHRLLLQRVSGRDGSSMPTGEEVAVDGACAVRPASRSERSNSTS